MHSGNVTILSDCLDFLLEHHPSPPSPEHNFSVSMGVGFLRPSSRECLSSCVPPVLSLLYEVWILDKAKV